MFKDSNTSLRYAIRNRNLEEVQRLFNELDVDIDEPDEHGMTPLYLAIFCGSENIVEFLIQEGANLDLPNAEGKTPLYLAIKSNYKKVAQLLIERGANVDLPNSRRDQEYPLYIAAKNGHADVARLLIEKGANVNRSTLYDKTSLHIAAENGHVDIVEILIEKGAEIDLLYNLEYTPLHLAAANGHAGIVKVLIEKGAKLGLFDNVDHTPLHLAAKNGHADVVKVLIEKGVDLNSVDYYKRTPLYCAAEAGHVDVARLLIERGANVNRANNVGRTPLHYFAEKGNADVVRLLIEKGANVDPVDVNGNTPLHYSSDNINMDVVRLLIERGANVNLVNNKGHAPLHCFADKGGNADVVRLLIKKGANVDLVDVFNLTPLHYSIANIVKGKFNADITSLLIGAAYARNTRYIGAAPGLLGHFWLAGDNIVDNFDDLIREICKSKESSASLALDMILRENSDNLVTKNRIIVAIADSSLGTVAMLNFVKHLFKEFGDTELIKGDVPRILKELPAVLDSLGVGAQVAMVEFDKGHFNNFVSKAAQNAYCRIRDSLQGLQDDGKAVLRDKEINVIAKMVAVNFAALLLSHEGDLDQMDKLVLNNLPKRVNEVGTLTVLSEKERERDEIDLPYVPPLPAELYGAILNQSVSNQEFMSKIKGSLNIGPLEPLVGIDLSNALVRDCLVENSKWLVARTERVLTFSILNNVHTNKDVKDLQLSLRKMPKKVQEEAVAVFDGHAGEALAAPACDVRDYTVEELSAGRDHFEKDRS